MTGTRKGRKHDLAVVERQQQALELRHRGLTYDVIAQHLGYANRSGAYKSIGRALHATLQAPADDLRRLEAERLDALHRAIWPTAIEGDLKSVDGVLAVMRRRAKLLGLSAPKQHEHGVAESVVQMVERVASRFGLDRQVVLAEAERILREIQGESKM